MKEKKCLYCTNEIAATSACLCNHCQQKQNMRHTYNSVLRMFGLEPYELGCEATSIQLMRARMAKEVVGNVNKNKIES